MSYTYSFQSVLSTAAVNSTVTTNHDYMATAQTTDYVRTTVILVPANSEVTIQLPGTNSIQAILVSSDELFDVALSEDVSNVPIYTGIFGTVYSRLFPAATGTLYDILNIRASANDAVVQITVTGLQATS